MICGRFELSERIQCRLWLRQHSILFTLSTLPKVMCRLVSLKSSVRYSLPQKGARSYPEIIRIKRNPVNRFKSKSLSCHSVPSAAPSVGLVWKHLIWTLLKVELWICSSTGYSCRTAGSFLVQPPRCLFRTRNKTQCAATVDTSRLYILGATYLPCIVH